MARFIGEVKGSKGRASRLGGAESGIEGHIRGWKLGGRVAMTALGDKDSVVLSLTGGSNGYSGLGVEIAAFEGADGRTSFVVRLPGNVEAHGYVGDDRVEFYKRTPGEYDPSAPNGELFYTTGKAVRS
jgi:hypothetical protein